MKVTKITSLVYSFHCPACNKGEHDVTHLINKPTNFGLWYCDVCGQAVNGSIEKDGSIEVEILEGRIQEDVLILLKIPPQEKDIFFILKGTDYTNERRTDDQHRYYYEEHTCPTNITSDIETIILDGDTDPHGIFEYVCAVPKPDISDDEYINLDYDTLNNVLLNALGTIDE